MSQFLSQNSLHLTINTFRKDHLCVQAPLHDNQWSWLNYTRNIFGAIYVITKFRLLKVLCMISVYEVDTLKPMGRKYVPIIYAYINQITSTPEDSQLQSVYFAFPNA